MLQQGIVRIHTCRVGCGRESRVNQGVPRGRSALFEGRVALWHTDDNFWQRGSRIITTCTRRVVTGPLVPHSSVANLRIANRSDNALRRNSRTRDTELRLGSGLEPAQTRHNYTRERCSGAGISKVTTRKLLVQKPELNIITRRDSEA